MVYLDADNNLEQFGIDDFLEMSTPAGLTGAGSQVRVLVQFDRIGGYDSRYGDWTSCKRFEVTTGKTPTIANAISDLGEANMGDPATLRDFINWGIAQAPANHYAVILWNHGGGWRSRGLDDKKPYKDVCWDDTNNGDCLYTRELRAALEAVPQHIDLIGFDACLMAMVEVAYEVKAECSVFVGSEQLEAGEGWPYDTIMADLVANPFMTPAQLGAVIVNRYGQSPSGPSGTQAATDLTKLETLATAISDFADAVLALSAANRDWETIRDSREAAGYYEYTSYRDLKGFMTGVAANHADATVRTKAQAVVDLLSAPPGGLVIQNYSDAGQNANGLSIYFPANATSVDADYIAAKIQFASKNWDEFLTAWCGAFVPPPPAPANNMFGSRITLSGSVVTTTGSNVNADKESGEPAHANNAGGHSVWWTWTAPGTGLAKVSLIGSSYDTLLGVYTGAAVNALTTIAYNDDYSGLQSQVSFSATAGVEYQIAVDGWGGAAGAISLSITQAPPNDNFANRITLSGSSATATGFNAGATKEIASGEVNHAGNAGGHSVWWTWTAPATATVQISTAGSDFDTLLAVYTGSAYPLSAGPSDNGGMSSQVSFGVTQNVTYQIAVDGRDGATGNISLSITLGSKVATPTFSPPPGNFASPPVVTISCATAGASIFYSLDGSEPATAYTDPVTINPGATLKAKATKTPPPTLTNSDVASGDYTIGTVATPRYSPAPGSYTGSTTVSISCDTAGATVHYTTDGTTPTTGSAVYSVPLLLDQTTRLQSLAVKAGMANSTIAMGQYMILQPQVATPTFNPPGAYYTAVQFVSIATQTSGATIYYTTDNSTPTTSSPVFTDPIRVAGVVTIKAMAVKATMANSEVGKADYSMPPVVAAPTFSPPAGTYTSAQPVTLACATSGATIRFTTDGTTPTSTSRAYSYPISVTATMTINAYALKEYSADSEVITSVYTFPPRLEAPTFNPPAGSYPDSQNVALACTTNGATIYYTTDGSTPTTSSPVYSAPISVTVKTTIKAYAVKPDMMDSTVASASYTVGPTPQITSGPTVVTTVCVAGQPVQFTAAADLPGVTWTWNYGDGTTETGTGIAVHTFAAGGSYMVVATAMTPGGQVASQSVNITVQAAGSVSNSRVDTDGDGICNEIEMLLGSSPTDASSAPAGYAGVTPQPLAITKAGVGVAFIVIGKDSVSLSGTLPIPEDFVVNGQQIVVDVGGVIRTFYPMDAKGKSPKSLTESFKIGIKAKKGVVEEQTAKFAVKFSKGTFWTSLQDEGLANIDIKDDRITVPVIILFNGGVYEADVPQTYSARIDKTGKTKMPKL
jgi:hypothetical protein